MFFITKVSLVTSLIVLTTIFAEIIGILDKKYLIPILYVCMVIQIIILIGAFIVIMRIRGIRGVKIIRYRLEDKFVKGETDIIPEYISPTNPGKLAMFKVFLEIDKMEEMPEFGLSKIGSIEKKDIKEHIVNINSGIVNDHFIFDADIVVRPGEKINFRLKKDTTIKLFFLGEFYIP